MSGLGSINSIPNISNMGIGTNPNMSNVMLPDPNYSNYTNGMIKMKQGSNNDFNQIFSNIKEGQMIQVLPEMQGLFDYNQIMNMPQKEFSSDVGNGNMAGLMNTSGPKIMDQGLLNQNMGMGNMGMGMGMGNMGMGNMGMGNMGMGNMGMGNMGMGMGDMGMKKQLPLISNPNLGSAISGEFGNNEIQQSNLSNQNILEGGFGFEDLNISERTVNNYKNIIKLKQGTINNFDLNNIQNGGVIEIPPEMQHNFNFEKIKQEKNISTNNLQENEKKKKFFFLMKKKI